MKFSYALLAVLFASGAFAQSSDCHVDCTAEAPLPVCGSDGKIYKIFNGRCDLSSQNCLDNNKWQEVKMNDCHEYELRCMRPCFKNYDPVCGYDGETFKVFSNKCVMENEHCMDGHVWLETKMSTCTELLESPKVDTCMKDCPNELEPVCGFVDETYKFFDSKCQFENQHCLDGKAWTLSTIHACLEAQQKEHEKLADCEKPCPKIFDPICGYNGLEYKLFDNECFFNNQHCLDSDHWIHVATRMCDKLHKRSVEAPKCEKACPRNYVPVCGFNGLEHKVFPNQCYFENENCKTPNTFIIVDMADCRQFREKVDCPKFCTMEYNPVCATHSKTNERKVFGNPCMFESFNCRQHRTWKQLDRTECPTPEIAVWEKPEQ